MESNLKNKIMKIKEDLALKIFESQTSTFDDLKNLNFLFDAIFRLIELLEKLILELRFKVFNFTNMSLI